MKGKIKIIRDVSPTVNREGDGEICVEYVCIAVVEEWDDGLCRKPRTDQDNPYIHVDQ